jgi:hypothetical protein
MQVTSSDRRKARIAVMKELRKARPDLNGVHRRSLADAIVKAAAENVSK